MSNTAVDTSSTLLFARRLAYGVVAWAVPYATALAILPLSRTDPALFKTIEVTVGPIVGTILAVAYFESVTHGFLREGLLLALVWIVENWLLDFVGVLPFTRLTVSRYFLEIGLVYIGMLAPTVGIGYVLERRCGLLH